MNKQDVNSKLLFKKENTKIIKADIIEDKEEYLVKNAITNQHKIKIIPKIQLNPKRKPMQVATPFPPLNFKNGEKEWPKIGIKLIKTRL